MRRSGQSKPQLGKSESNSAQLNTFSTFIGSTAKFIRKKGILLPLSALHTLKPLNLTLCMCPILSTFFFIIQLDKCPLIWRIISNFDFLSHLYFFNPCLFFHIFCIPNIWELFHSHHFIPHFRQHLDCQNRSCIIQRKGPCFSRIFKS